MRTVDWPEEVSNKELQDVGNKSTLQTDSNSGFVVTLQAALFNGEPRMLSRLEITVMRPYIGGLASLERGLLGPLSDPDLSLYTASRPDPDEASHDGSSQPLLRLGAVLTLRQGAIVFHLATLIQGCYHSLQKK